MRGRDRMVSQMERVGEDTEVKRQKGRDRGEKTERRDDGGETGE
jgi:hypothetical protein